MTALRKYMRLESSGLWRETPEARLRDVVVGLREATLVLSDPKTETALSQWSLPAVERLNPGKMPALYGVGDADSETLEIDDPDMALAQARQGAKQARVLLAQDLDPSAHKQEARAAAKAMEKNTFEEVARDFH